MDNLPPLPSNYEWHLKYGGLNYMKLRLRKKVHILGVSLTITKGKAFIYVDESMEREMRIASNQLASHYLR